MRISQSIGYKTVLYNWRYTESDTEEKNQQNNNKYSVALKTYSVLAAGLFHSVVQ